MGVPNVQTDGYGPIELATRRANEEALRAMEGRDDLESLGVALATTLATQEVIARGVDDLGRMFFGERWDTFPHVGEPRAGD